LARSLPSDPDGVYVQVYGALNPHHQNHDEKLIYEKRYDNQATQTDLILPAHHPRPASTSMDLFVCCL
jgi:hypothetical protein